MGRRKRISAVLGRDLKVKCRIAPWLLAMFLGFSAVLAAIPVSASAAAGTGFISLGNLSATPSPVDVYLYSSGDSSPQIVDRGVAYGTILPYQQVNAGDYTVKMRTAGSSASSNPVWSVSLTVKAGGTYTVVPLRTSAQQGQLKVIDNNLTTPKGKSFVRVIQADVNQQQVTFHCSCAAGAPGDITTDAAPGTVSPQAPIPAGTWTMTATGSSAKTSLPVTLTAGTVHTEIVIAAPGGGIQIINLEDAAGAGQAPTGGASTGFGGTAPHPAGSPLPWLTFIGAGALLTLAGGWQLGRNRLRRLTPS
ncbi:MAG TPA: DUF4397 domain-containing protein [Streptosporangiaceae bacterium]|nr:DUF4397 domain-containing protein [Streptosporangiaceae bacterium]